MAQLIGWGIFALINIYIAILAEDLNWKILAANVSLAIAGVLLTHLYRDHILKKHWHEFKTNELIYKVLMYCIPIALALCIWQFILLYFFYKRPDGELNFATLINPFIAAYTIVLIWNVLYFTWSYIERNRQQMIAQLELQNDLKDLEIKNIKSNLQPHFIFNSLNSIRALVSEDPDTARSSITKLSKILRSSISEKENAVPLSKEMQLVEDYLHLEKIRFEERLNYSIDINPTTSQVLIPPMLLQTLVENAVKHGISQLEQGGQIEIKAWMERQMVHISISNDGKLDPLSKAAGTGFGLEASKKRLKYTCGSDADLTMSYENDKVQCLVRIPQHNYTN